MKVLTLNTHSWMEDEPLQKLEILADTIIEQAFDVICLQEINQLIDSLVVTKPLNYHQVAGTPAIHEDNFVLKLVDRLWQKGQTYYWSWAYNHIGFDIYHEGVAILTKTPFLEVNSLLVSDVDDETDYHTRRALQAKVTVGQKTFNFVSLHLSWWEKGFEEEWQKLEAQLKAEQGDTFFLMGDFNNPQGNPGYQLVLASDLQLQDSHVVAKDVYGQATIEKEIAGWEGNKEALKVDYIFTSQGISVQQSQVIFNDANYPIISDHCGLAVQIEVDN